MAHPREGIEILGVIGIRISFVGDEGADDGGWNVSLVPSSGVETGHGDLVAGDFCFAGRLNLPILVEIGSVRGTIGGSREIWNDKRNDDSRNPRQGNTL
jgi:hypothetical protein